MAPERIFANRAELARVLGVSVPTLDRLVELGLPVEEGGDRGRPYRFCVEDAVAWKRARDDEEAATERARLERLETLRLPLEGGANPPDGAAPVSAKARAEVYDAELKGLRLARERGELVPAEMVRRDYEAMFQLLRQEALALGPSLGRRFGFTQEQTRAVDGEVRRWLRGLMRAIQDPSLRPAQEPEPAADAA